MFQQCLCACEPVVAVCASYRCSRHVYQAWLGQAQQCLCMRQPVRAALASYPSGAPAMFVSHVSAMPLHMRARGGRACIVSVLLACLPGTFKIQPSSAFACASRCGPRLYRIRLVLLPCLSAMFQQCLCTCEPVVAVRASYRYSWHVYLACLGQAQQCLCLREPVRAVLGSYPIGAPAMFVSHNSAMPLHMRARGGRVCIASVLPACLRGMFKSSPAMPLLARASAGRACIVSDWCSCHVCHPRDSNAFAHASPSWSCVHRTGAPGMFTRHV